MAAEKKKVAPELCSYVDDDHTMLTIEVSIPGVSKGDIALRMHEDSLNLSAPREDVEFVTTLSFCCSVKVDEADAVYENGRLKIRVPFKESMEDVLDVEIK